MLERADERRAIAASLDATEGGQGRCVVIAGMAGMGKTHLLRACEEAACERGFVVVRARGDNPRGGGSSLLAARELLWPAVQEAGRSAWLGPAAAAKGLFVTGKRAAAEEPEPSDAVIHGLFWLVAHLAAQSPLVMLVDDAQWLDVASRRFLACLVHRIARVPALLVLAVRDGEGHDPAGLASACSAAEAIVLRPSPLSAGASARLVRRVLGEGADDDLCTACFDATCGHPLYLTQLAATLSRIPPASLEAPDELVRGAAAEAIGSNIAAYLAGCGEDCERLAAAAALLAPPSALRHAATLADMEPNRAEAAADALRAAGLLGPQRPLAFAQPIVRDAVAMTVPPARRAALHRRAAGMLAVDRAPTDQIAEHLLRAEPFADRWVVETLRDAARDALAGGAPERAVAYLRRALSEPPAGDLRLSLLLELGRAETLLPCRHDSPALREALELAPDQTTRAEITVELAEAVLIRSDDGFVPGMLEAALEVSHELGDAAIERVETSLVGAGAGDLAARRAHARIPSRLKRARAGEMSDPVLLSALSSGAFAGVSAADVAAMARRALGRERVPASWSASVGAVFGLALADQLDEAEGAAEAALAEAERRGAAPVFMRLSILRGLIALRGGELELAEAHTLRGLDLARELGAEHWASMWQAEILVERGRGREAEELLESLELSEKALARRQGAVLLASRGRLRVTRGEHERGLADLLEADHRMSAAGMRLSVLCDWTSSAAQALSSTGRSRHARELAERELAAATDYGAARGRGIALSLLGQLDGGEEGLASLREAVDVLEGSPARLEHGQALLGLGIGLRTRGASELAREPLSRALDIAHGCGAVRLAEHAREVLVATGARPRRSALTGTDALTPAQLRAATMAAEGMTNGQIAEALYVVKKTVEAHLRTVYSKLQISGRAQLRDALEPAAAEPRAATIRG